MEQKINTNLLLDIGLSMGEIKVYLALFKLGSSSTGNIVTEAKIHSSKVYSILDRLIDKGLVSYSKLGKKTIYSVTSANYILDYLNEKQKSIEKQKIQATTLITELESLKLFHNKKSEASVFKELKGFEVAIENFSKQIDENEEVLIFATTKFNKNLRRKFLDSLSIIKNKIRMCIDENSELKDSIEKLKKVRIKKIQETFIPALIYISENFVLISVDDGKTTFSIDNNDVGVSFKHYFETIWKSTTRVYYGKEGAEKVVEELIEAGKKGLPNYGFGTHDNPYRIFVPDVLDKFFEAEKKYNIDTKLLFMEGGEHEQPNAKVKYLPKEYLSPVRTMIYEDSVAMVDFTEPWTTIIIDKKEIADSFKNYFMTLWNSNTRVYHGDEGPKIALMEYANEGRKGNYVCGFGTDKDDYLKYFKETLQKCFSMSVECGGFDEKLLFGHGFKSPNPTAEVRVLPEGMDIPVRTMIYGDKVAIVDFSIPMTTIIIEKKSVADAYRKYFDYLWKIAK